MVRNPTDHELLENIKHTGNVYNFWKAVLFVIIIAMVGLVLYNQTRIIDNNHLILQQIQADDIITDNHIQCLAKEFAENPSPNKHVIENCLTENRNTP